jgi:hypothetical protein
MNLRNPYLLVILASMILTLHITLSKDGELQPQRRYDFMLTFLGVAIQLAVIIGAINWGRN